MRAKNNPGFFDTLFQFAVVAATGGLGLLAYRGIRSAIIRSNEQKASTISAPSKTTSSRGGVFNTLLKPPYSNSYEDRRLAEAKYKEIFASFQQGKASGTNEVTKLSSTTSEWTTKIRTPDGSVIYKSATGTMATKGDDGKWQYFDSNGSYMYSKTPTSTTETAKPVLLNKADISSQMNTGTQIMIG